MAAMDGTAATDGTGTVAGAGMATVAAAGMAVDMAVPTVAAAQAEGEVRGAAGAAVTGDVGGENAKAEQMAQTKTAL
jgi:hypothetical protein